MGGGGGLGRLPADRLGRAASMEASGAVAAAANSGSGAAPASHAASPEGLVDEAWFFSLIDFCLLAPQLNFVLWFPFFPYPWHFLPRQCCGSGMFIPDPNFFHPGSASKNLSILTQKSGFHLTEIWSGLFIPDPDHDFTHPGSRDQKGTGSRIWIRNTAAHFNFFTPSLCTIL
jgi:hypothetical protein